ncbi:NAD(P)-dependent oxidoreductase [Sphingobium nicotianae]|uniref:2-hydroxyacid dehydrogenase n=1 Tax=Sphingobium nicotianae TaxID=2782607 RepID=A0A9X1DE86_9SPHN|nr:NAD(P)-dependent oxidoreductase [Sphingobium nicotianae]MBT2188284.1 2-hydroxyacid dehydrogenase [Sphingobium nicotianae]
MSGGAILIHSRFLVDRLGPIDLPAPVFTPDDVADGIPPGIAAQVEVLVTGGAVPNALIDALPCLRLVACFSTGYEGIDLAHLHARGITLTTAAGVNAHDVADHALALLLALWHRIPTADRDVRDGRWRESLPPRHSLRGRSAGVVGLGRIGLAIARRLAAHELQVGWYGPREKAGVEFARAPSLLALAERSDILIVASRAVPENMGQIDADVLAALGPQGVLVNVSRGFLVDEPALLAALRSGGIAGAAVDVFAQEPVDAAIWRALPNVVLTPHLGGFTVEAGTDMIGQLRENVRRHFRGEPLLTPEEIDDRTVTPNASDRQYGGAHDR